VFEYESQVVEELEVLRQDLLAFDLSTIEMLIEILNTDFSTADFLRFISKVKLNKDDGCWEWMGWRDRGGYGRFKYHNSSLYVHRFSSLLFRGPIPDGYDVHHVCEKRNCVNPMHLILEEQNRHRGQIYSGQGRCKKGRFTNKKG